MKRRTSLPPTHIVSSLAQKTLTKSKRDVRKPTLSDVFAVPSTQSQTKQRFDGRLGAAELLATKGAGLGLAIEDRRRRKLAAEQSVSSSYIYIYIYIYYGVCLSRCLWYDMASYRRGLGTAVRIIRKSVAPR